MDMLLTLIALFVSLCFGNCREIPFSAEVYNALPHFWDTYQNSESSLIPIFGKLFRQYGVENFIGLQLLHKHFDVYEREQIVDEMYGNVSIARAISWESLNYINTTFGVIGHRFKVTEFGDLIPLEFSVISEENNFILDGYKQLTSKAHKIFLYEFSRILSKFNLFNIFGIGIKHFQTCDTIETTEDGDRYLVTRSRDDHILWMKKQKKTQDMPETTVFWDFDFFNPDNEQWPLSTGACTHCSHSCRHCNHCYHSC